MRSTEGDEYLQRNRKQAMPWMNQCVSCQHLGHKPELPETIHPGVLAENIRRYFKPLVIDENGLCEQCAASLAHQKSVR